MSFIAHAKNFTARAFFIAISLSLFACGSSGNSAAPVPQQQIVPGETFTILDASISNNGYHINFVIRNNMNYTLPTFTIDYKLECDAGETKYARIGYYTTVSSNKQISESIYPSGTKVSSCVLTLLAVRPSHNRGYIDWTGEFVLNVQ